MGYVLCGTFPRRYLLSALYMPHPTRGPAALPGPGDDMVVLIGYLTTPAAYFA